MWEWRFRAWWFIGWWVTHPPDQRKLSETLTRGLNKNWGEYMRERGFKSNHVCYQWLTWLTGSPRNCNTGAVLKAWALIMFREKECYSQCSFINVNIWSFFLIGWMVSSEWINQSIIEIDRRIMWEKNGVQVWYVVSQITMCSFQREIDHMPTFSIQYNTRSMYIQNERISTFYYQWWGAW